MAAAPQEKPSSDVFSLRIVSMDYYMATPIPDLDFSYSDFQGREVEEVPVIRIYGSTPAGGMHARPWGSASLHYKKVNYLLLERDGHIQVIIHKQSTPQDILQSFIHALVILKLLDKAKAVHIESRQWMDDNYTVFLAKLRSAGWSTERLLSQSIVWRAHWVHDFSDDKINSIYNTFTEVVD